MKRALADIFLVLSVFLLPPFLSALLAAVFIFVFDDFAEGVVAAWLLDTFYGGGGVFGLAFHYVFSAAMLVLYLASFRIKEAVAFYA